MIRAFGFCSDTFDPADPGRLCRGRERWIEALPDTPSTRVHRTVCSGAVFSDASAEDALRGFHFSGAQAGPLLRHLFPDARVFGFCEAGDPRALPAAMVLEEDHVQAIAGGLRARPSVRWVAEATPADVDLWMQGERDGLAAPRADGFVILDSGEVAPALVEAIFRLVGFSEPDELPSRRYNPGAIPEVLRHARALVLLHLDKHGPVLAMYLNEPLESDGIIDLAARSAGSFPVPFVIPPMLARWDRALYEYRLEWDSETDGEFPVPPAEDTGGRWSSRRRRRGRQADAVVEEAGREEE